MKSRSYIEGQCFQVGRETAQFVAKTLKREHERLCDSAISLQSIRGYERLRDELREVSENAREYALDGIIEGRFAELAHIHMSHRLAKLEEQAERLRLQMKALNVTGAFDWEPDSQHGANVIALDR